MSLLSHARFYKCIIISQRTSSETKKGFSFTVSLSLEMLVPKYLNSMALLLGEIGTILGSKVMLLLVGSSLQ